MNNRIARIFGVVEQRGMPIELLLSLLRHRRAAVLGALLIVIAAAWGYLWLGAGVEMEMMDQGHRQMMAMPAAWSLPHGLLLFVMWVVMMVAMMLPSAAPTVLLVAALAWGRLANPNLAPVTALLFALGYLLVWWGFALGATLLQWGLDEAGLLSKTMAFGNAVLASTVLIAAGVYQWTSLKDTCLRHCRSPTDFLVRHWRPGSLGPVRTGVRHGLFCLGCCWMLMTLLFVGGLMNLTWIGAIALFVLLEKIMPHRDWMSRFTGLLFAIWGATILVRMV